MPAVRGGRALTVIELIAAYKTHCEGYYVKDGQPTHILHNIRCAMSRVRTLYGSAVVEDFGPACLKAVRQSWVDDSLSLRTVNYKTQWVKRMVRRGVAEELVPATVLHALQAVDPLKAGRCPARPLGNVVMKQLRRMI